MLNGPPVQSFHNSTANFRVHASVTFLINSDEMPLLTGCFLKHLEMSPFHWRWFCRYMINRLGHAFPRTRNIFANGALISTIYSPCSFADVMFSSGNFGQTFFCFVSFVHLQSNSESKSTYFYHACATHPKVALVNSSTKALGYSWKKIRRPCLFEFHK